MHCKNDCAESLEGQENAEKISEKKSDSADGMSVNSKFKCGFYDENHSKKNLPGSMFLLHEAKNAQQEKIIFPGCLIILQNFMETDFLAMIRL